VHPAVPLPRGLRCAPHLPSKLLLELSQGQAAAFTESVAMSEPFDHGYTPEPGRPLRIGYVLAGFGGAAAQHFAGVFVGHSHAGKANTAQHHLGMQVTCFTQLPGGRNSETDKIQKWVNSRWTDISSLPIADAAQRIRDSRVQLLVNVDGFSSNERTAVLAMQPAPVQVGYRSHPGSQGADWLDYSIADAFGTPPSATESSPERLAILPIMSHANDYWHIRRNHDIAPMRAPDRDDYGVPMRRLVLQNLGLYGRIDPTTWTSWTNMLARLPNCTLWLLRSSNYGEAHLEAQLKAAGVDIDNNRNRVRFSDPVAREEHIRRSALGDIHLDTPLFNGHTMTVETLWSGTTVATVALEAHTQRVAGAALRAAQNAEGHGMGEMVSLTRKEHEDLVVSLSLKEQPRNPGRPHVSMFDLTGWVQGGLNPIMQKYAQHGRTLVSGT